MGKKSFGGHGRGCGCGIGCGCGCCGNSLCPLCLFFFNTIFFIAAAVFVGIGIWVKVEENYVSFQEIVDHGLGDNIVSSVGYALIGFGIFVVVFCAFGYLAICYPEKKCRVVTYVLCLLVIFGCVLAAAIVYGTSKGKVDDTLSNSLTKTIKSYTEGSDYADDWDNVQTWLTCCGSKGPKDYDHVKFKDPDMFVPVTCCVLTNSDSEHPQPKNGTECQLDARMYIDGNITSSQVLKTTGCFKSIQDILYDNRVTIIGVGVAFAVLQILGIVLTCGLCISRENNYNQM